MPLLPEVSWVVKYHLYIEICSLKINLGAHVTIFSRRLGPLEDAKNEIVTNCADASRQEINAVPLDLADAGAVRDPGILLPW